MKTLILFPFSLFLIQTTALSQSLESAKLNRIDLLGWHYEFGIMPLLIHNQGNFGLTKRVSDKTEHNVELNLQIQYFIDGWINSYGLLYSLNKTIAQKTKSRFYIPLWTKARRINSVNANADGFGTEYLLSSIGSGIGYKRIFKNKSGIKMELHAGAGTLLNWQADDYNFIPQNHIVGIRKYLAHGLQYGRNVAVLPIPRIKIRYTLPLGI